MNPKFFKDLSATVLFQTDAFLEHLKLASSLQRSGHGKLLRGTSLTEAILQDVPSPPCEGEYEIPWSPHQAGWGSGSSRQNRAWPFLPSSLGESDPVQGYGEVNAIWL